MHKSQGPQEVGHFKTFNGNGEFCLCWGETEFIIIYKYLQMNVIKNVKFEALCYLGQILFGLNIYPIKP